MGLDIVELVMAVETHFGIEVAEEDVGRVMTVGGMFAYVTEKLEAQDQLGWRDAQWTKERAWLELANIIEYQSGTPSNKITLDAHFAHDLGMD